MKAYTITCHRLASSALGAGAEPLKGRDGRIQPFASLEDARGEAARLNAAKVSLNVFYSANPEPKEIAL